MLFKIPSLKMPNIDLESVMKQLLETNRRTQQIWLTADSMAFIARGREYRSEFHINPSDEVMYMIKGQMNLHFRDPNGKEDIAVLKEGASIYTASGIPHSPRFPPDAFLLVLERKRRPGEVDRFQWFCPSCDALLHEESFVVADYALDPVSKAYKTFFDSQEFRTCKSCGTVMPRP